MKKLLLTSIIIVIALFALAIYFYTILPDTIITHWGASGQANGYMPKLIGVFLFPLIILGILLLFIFLPKLDPLRKNYPEFRKYYDSFIFVLVLFFSYIYIISIIWNLGIMIPISMAIIPAIGFLFIFIGIILRNIKQNWFLGIRTPWTLSNKEVWDKTHKNGSIFFIFSGIIALLGIFFPQRYFIWFILVPVIASAVWMYVYSYLLYRKIERKK